MLIVSIFALEGTLLGLGASLLVDVIANRQESNLLFVSLFVAAGLVIGLLIGLIFSQNVIEQPWMILVGQGATAIVGALIMLAVFSLGDRHMEWRLVGLASVLGSIPGAAVGLMLTRTGGPSSPRGAFGALGHRSLLGPGPIVWRDRRWMEQPARQPWAPAGVGWPRRAGPGRLGMAGRTASARWWRLRSGTGTRTRRRLESSAGTGGRWRLDPAPAPGIGGGWSPQPPDAPGPGWGDRPATPAQPAPGWQMPGPAPRPRPGPQPGPGPQFGGEGAATAPSGTFSPMMSRLTREVGELQTNSHQRVTLSVLDQGRSGRACVVVLLAESVEDVFTLYLTCGPGYPGQPPDVLLSRRDSVQMREAEVPYVSRVVQQWHGGRSLREIVAEAQQFTAAL